LEAALTRENLHAAREYVQSGKRVVVGVDLAKLFDRVNHDIVMNRLRKCISEVPVMHTVKSAPDAARPLRTARRDSHRGARSIAPHSDARAGWIYASHLHIRNQLLQTRR